MGRVIGTQDATPLEFWVLLEEGEAVQVDEAVVVETDSPTGPVKLFGMVDIIRARHQGSTVRSFPKAHQSHRHPTRRPA